MESLVETHRKEISTLLRTKYKIITIENPVTRTAENGVLLSDYFQELRYRRSDVEAENVLLREIFEPDDNGKAILLYGGLGAGKTTTAAKLVHDWAIGKKYISKQFNLGILISGNNCAETLYDTIVNATGMDLEKKDNVMTVIEDPSTKLLLVVDDFERMVRSKQIYLRSIIRGERKAKPTVVIMLKSATRNFEEPNVSDCDYLGSDMKRFVQGKFEIIGINGNFEHVKKTKIVQMRLGPQLTSTTDSHLNKVLLVWAKGKSILEIYPLHLIILTEVLMQLNISDANLTQIHEKVYKKLVSRHLEKTQCSDLHALNEDDVKSAMLEIAENAFVALKEQSSSQALDKSVLLNSRIPAFVYGLNSKSINDERGSAVILEFAAAYHLCLTVLASTESCQFDQKQSILSVRPHWDGQPSFCYRFLLSLAGQNCHLILNALAAYSPVYSFFFGLLGLSLMETTLTETVKMALLPFLPAEWKIPCRFFSLSSLDKMHKEFYDSDVHEDLMDYALNKNTQIFRWDTSFEARLPQHLKVEWLILEFTSVKHSIDKNKTIECGKLHIILSDLPENNESDAWKEILGIIQLIGFKKVSFQIKKNALVWLRLICNSSTVEDKLKEVRWLTCSIEAQAEIDVLTTLLQTVKVKGLQLVICHTQPTTHCKGDETSFEQSVNSLVQTAANTKPNRLVIINKCQPFTFYWKHLFGTKSWKWVQLTGVNITFEPDTEENSVIKIKHLDLEPKDVSDHALSNVVKSLDVRSLNCNLSVLTKPNLSLLNKGIKRLDVRIDSSSSSEALSVVNNFFHYLQVLSVSLSKTEKDLTCSQVEKWLRESSKCISLKGIEIWGIETNPILANHLVEFINWCIRDKDPYTNSSKKQKTGQPVPKLKLEYLMLNLGPVSDEGEQDSKLIENLIKIAEQLKPSITDKKLPQLDIVCEEVFFHKMFTSCGNFSWVGTFPLTEGFSIVHDCWGMAKDDSFHSQEAFGSCPGECNRLRITAKKHSVAVLENATDYG